MFEMGPTFVSFRDLSMGTILPGSSRQRIGIRNDFHHGSGIPAPLEFPDIWIFSNNNLSTIFHCDCEIVFYGIVLLEIALHLLANIEQIENESNSHAVFHVAKRPIALGHD
jgi:hypothetical protein